MYLPSPPLAAKWDNLFFCCDGVNHVARIVVLSVLLVNAHTWGLNSSYAVFLAYYLRSGTIAGSSPLGFAFVGGLSISTGRPTSINQQQDIADSHRGSPFGVTRGHMVYRPVWHGLQLAGWRRARSVRVQQPGQNPLFVIVAAWLTDEPSRSQGVLHWRLLLNAPLAFAT